MKVIVWTDRDIPNVALYNWVRVGSRNEVPGITGLAHFFEHMMFNGTAQAHAGRVRPAHGSAGRLQQRVHQRRRHGLPGLDPAHGARADLRPRSPIASPISPFDPKVIESERGVVYSERRLRVEDNNEGFLAEQVQATAFVAHPYQIPDHRLAGRHPGLEARRPAEVLQDQLRAEQLHADPGRATSSAEEGFALAKKYLEPIPRQEPPPPVRTARARAARREARARASATRRRRCCTTPTSRRRPTIRRARPSTC